VISNHQQKNFQFFFPDEKLFLNEHFRRLHFFLLCSLVQQTWKLSYVSWFLLRIVLKRVYSHSFFLVLSFIIIISTSFVIRRNCKAQKKMKNRTIKDAKKLREMMWGRGKKFQLQTHAYYLSSFRSLVSTTHKKRKYTWHIRCAVTET
jgi:hypothetical protein